MLTHLLYRIASTLDLSGHSQMLKKASQYM